MHYTMFKFILRIIRCSNRMSTEVHILKLLCILPGFYLLLDVQGSIVTYPCAK